ncbi:MAG: hypothetical protein ACFFAH_12270, partial [Promethearchaeota archaeon]
FLYFSILSLFLIDMVIQAIKKRPMNLKFITFHISKSGFIILVLAVGFILISIGIYLGKLYMVPGDAWIGLAPAKYLSDSSSSPIDWGNKNTNYPIFWSYIIFGYSILSGLPLFNINALLAPFCYLFVTSIYLLCRAILFEFEDKYIVLSTFLIVLFSYIFHFSFQFTIGRSPGIIVIENFFYKSYAFLLFFVALALMLVLLKNPLEKNDNQDKILRKTEFKLIVLCSFFLILSFMLYLIPLLMGLAFITIYFLITAHSKKSINILFYLIFFIIIFFIIFDIIMEFYLTSSLFFLIPWILQLELLSFIFELIPPNILFYSIFVVILFIIQITKIIYLKYFKGREKKIGFSNLDSDKLFKYWLVTFTILLLIELFIILIDQLSDESNLTNKITFFYVLDSVLITLGITGISGLYLCKSCFNINKKLFFILIFWILITFLISISLIFFYIFQSQSFFVMKIDARSKIFMELWFSRTWYYSILPLGILSSIGIFELAKRVKNFKIIKTIYINEFRSEILKNLIIFLFIYLSFSNFFILGINRGYKEDRIKDEQVELFEWMSKNIPKEKNFLIEKDYIIRVGIFSMVNGRYFFIDDIFDSDENMTQNIDEMDELLDEEIEYLLVSEDFLNDDSDLSDFIKIYLIPNFYNETEYNDDKYTLYFASYFD